MKNNGNKRRTPPSLWKPPDFIEGATLQKFSQILATLYLHGHNNLSLWRAKLPDYHLAPLEASNLKYTAPKDTEYHECKCKPNSQSVECFQQG